MENMIRSAWADCFRSPPDRIRPASAGWYEIRWGVHAARAYPTANNIFVHWVGMDEVSILTRKATGGWYQR